MSALAWLAEQAITVTYWQGVIIGVSLAAHYELRRIDHGRGRHERRRHDANGQHSHRL